MVREVLFGVGFALLLPMRFGLDGALYSMPVSDLLTFLICLAVIVYTCRTLDLDCANAQKLCENRPLHLCAVFGKLSSVNSIRTFNDTRSALHVSLITAQ